MPCAECGASLDGTADTLHACSRERRVEYQMFGLREEIAGLEAGVARFLGTPLDRFEVWSARAVRARPGLGRTSTGRPRGTARQRPVTAEARMRQLTSARSSAVRA